MRSKNLIIASVLLTLCIFLLAGCRAISNRYEPIEIETGSSDEPETHEEDSSIEALYGYQLNFSKGTATLNIIPETMVQELYDKYDVLKEENAGHLPIQIREYAVTDTVYFDYDTDCSIVWDKKTGDVRIEQTDIIARDEFMQKQHK